VNRRALESELQRVFDADPESARVVGRAARDLADAGRYRADFDYDLSVEVVIDNLRDAPDDHTAVERWNWWLGALELSHGGYEQFRIRPGVV